MQKVDESHFLAAPIEALISQLKLQLYKFGFRINRVLPKDGTEAMSNPLILASFTTATRPSAGSWTGGIIFVSDGAAGSKFQGSDGSAWVSLG